jgi:hypothetical protein
MIDWNGRAPPQLTRNHFSDGGNLYYGRIEENHYQSARLGLRANKGRAHASIELADFNGLLRDKLQWESPKGLHFVRRRPVRCYSFVGSHFHPYLNRFMYSSACSHHVIVSPEKKT